MIKYCDFISEIERSKERKQDFQDITRTIGKLEQYYESARDAPTAKVRFLYFGEIIVIFESDFVYFMF